MKVFTYYCLASFVFVFFFSCTREKRNIDIKIEKIEINTDKVVGEINLLEMIDSISYIPITTDSILIGEVTDFVVSNDKFFILDRKKSHSIFIIERDGENLIQIDREGAGPEEYISPRTITIDEENRYLLILCDKSKRIQTYDFEGNFINTRRINCYSSLIAKTQTGNIVYYLDYLPHEDFYKESSYPNLILLGKKNKLLDAEAYFDSSFESTNLWKSKKGFSKPYSDTISINPDHSNIVYYVSNDKITPRYYIDCGKYNIDEGYNEEVLMKPLKSPEDLSKMSEKYGLIMSYKESSDYIYVLLLLQGEYSHTIFSKRTGNSRSFRAVQGAPLDFGHGYISGNKFYTLVEPSTLKRYAEELKDSKLLEIANKVNDFDNPVIIESTLADF
ncbi:6-bladed beta-propeller [Dysgonomonas macrotermitis]|nr:6-bladed beta-propeller [Dysgonomonas macrotermitis]